jgi:hypothetical protein
VGSFSAHRNPLGAIYTFENWRQTALFNFVAFLDFNMGASFKLLTLQKKQEIIDYILSNNQNGEKKRSSRTWNLKRTAQSYEIHGEKLFLKRKNHLLEVICTDETEKIYSTLQSIHLPGHRGIFFY